MTYQIPCVNIQAVEEDAAAHGCTATVLVDHGSFAQMLISGSDEAVQSFIASVNEDH